MTILLGGVTDNCGFIAVGVDLGRSFEGRGVIERDEGSKRNQSTDPSVAFFSTFFSLCRLARLKEPNIWAPKGLSETLPAWEAERSGDEDWDEDKSDLPVELEGSDAG